MQALAAAVIDASEACSFEAACLEWDIIDTSYDLNGYETCTCGKKFLKNLFRIKNRKTERELFPIGSECIKRFENTRMDNQLVVWGWGALKMPRGTKHYGKTFAETYENYPEYVEFVIKNARKAKLCKFCDYATMRLESAKKVGVPTKTLPECHD